MNIRNVVFSQVEPEVKTNGWLTKEDGYLVLKFWDNDGWHSLSGKDFNGASLYDEAVKHGYTGTEEDYINSIVLLGRLDQIGTSYEQFKEVVPDSNNNIIINFARTPFSKVTLSGRSSIFNLSIINTINGDVGKILVYQTGMKSIIVEDPIKGSINLPSTRDTVALLSFNRIDDIIYITSQILIDDIKYPNPQQITDLQIKYYDATTAVVQWTSTYANNIYDVPTSYDMRYSNSPVDPNNSIVWNGLNQIKNLPSPAINGTIQTMTLSGLDPGKDFYIYLKNVRVNYGIKYSSLASNPVNFRTLGYENTSKALRIEITGDQLFSQSSDIAYNNNLLDYCTLDKMVDETELNTYDSNGYPNTDNKNYSTYWVTGNYYSRATSPYDLLIDLYTKYTLDKIYLFGKEGLNISVYIMEDFTYPWVKVGVINSSNNEYGLLNFKGLKGRFIKLSFDLMDFGSESDPVIPEGSTGFPDPSWNESISKIHNLTIYGRSESNTPFGITSPLRNYVQPRTVDQWFCTNGHAYQQGRIHSFVSGKLMRMYINYGHFGALDPVTGALTSYSTLSDLRFRVNQIPWITGNNGTEQNFKDHLENTYKKYNLKPFLTNTGKLDIFKNSYTNYGRMLDCYWYPGAWKAVPSRGVGGLDRYFSVSKSPSSYKTMSKLCYALAAKYGKNVVDGSTLFYPNTEDTTTGLDLISGLEVDNEPDKSWNGWGGYTSSEECAALVSSSWDGNSGTNKDENNNIITGLKGGGLISISPGLAGLNPGYILQELLYDKSVRITTDLSSQVISLHQYFGSGYLRGNTNTSVTYGITFEKAIQNATYYPLLAIIKLRNLYFPSTEIAMTEFGWGEAGARNTTSNLQCYSKPGKIVDGWLIPDRHRSDVKGSYIVRAAIQMMNLGIGFANYYMTECEDSYFDTGQWGSGAGFEMFHWNDVTDTTPGAKYNAIEKFECQYSRGGFSSTGLFGMLIGNGGYPITRAAWWVITLRNRLKDFVFIGMKSLVDNPNVVVACFRKLNENKGAYVVYLNSDTNDGLKNVHIPLPSDVTTVTNVTMYIPEIPNPELVPNDLANDQARTGLPCARHEIYTSGQWVIKDEYYWQDYKFCYALGNATYPSNPVEGDEVVVLPTTAENPYFPIVGPVAAVTNSLGMTLGANQYLSTSNGKPSISYNIALSWRQVNAICDYIQYSPEGIHGCQGTETTLNPVAGNLVVNVSEFPEYYFFDAVPDIDFNSTISNLTSTPVNSTSIKLYWNNTNTSDTGYQIFSSALQETGYSLLETINVGVDNSTIITGLLENTTYYFKIRPINGTKLGTMSSYTGVTTYKKIEPITNLRSTDNGATSLTLAWDYTITNVSDFVYYAIYRSTLSSSFTLLTQIDDGSLKTYQDTNLTSGTVYNYKIKVVGLNGVSDYSSSLQLTTLTIEESPPVLTNITTDKLGTKLILTFDIALGSVTDSLGDFTLTENGNSRLIKTVTIDSANTNRLFLGLATDSLMDYDKYSDIELAYINNNHLLSKYNIAVKSFSNVRVTNVIGNFINLYATYKIDLGFSDTVKPVTGNWNTLYGDPLDVDLSCTLIDITGNTSNLSISNIRNTSPYIWNGYLIANGMCTIADIPESVYKVGWKTAHGSTNLENSVGRLHVIGADDSHKYTVRAFGGVADSNSKIGKAKIKVGSLYSNSVNQYQNGTSYMVVEDIKATNSIFNIDLIHDVDIANDEDACMSFLIIEEYMDNAEPPNTDVFIRDLTANEAVSGVIQQKNITIHINYIGTPTMFRISEDDTMAGISYTTLTSGQTDINYNVSDNAGTKNIYVQIKNDSSESNIKKIALTYIPVVSNLALNNIYINNEDASTSSKEVNIFFDISGTPTSYRLAETTDSLNTASWITWGTGSVYPFTLSDGYSQKTVYGQIKDSTVVSSIKVDTINYINSDISPDVGRVALICEPADSVSGHPSSIYNNLYFNNFGTFSRSAGLSSINVVDTTGANWLVCEKDSSSTTVATAISKYLSSGWVDPEKSTYDTTATSDSPTVFDYARGFYYTRCIQSQKSQTGSKAYCNGVILSSVPNGTYSVKIYVTESSGEYHDSGKYFVNSETEQFFSSRPSNPYNTPLVFNVTVTDGLLLIFRYLSTDNGNAPINLIEIKRTA